MDDSSTGNAPFLTTITNDGTIQGTQLIGIKIISNFADVIVNNGTITGGGGTAIQFGTGNNTLQIGTSSVINGTSDGGAGTDTLDYTNFAGAVSVDLASGTATGTGGVTNFENVIGGAGTDTLTGDGNANVLNGGAGADTMAGAGGNDLYYVDNISDVVTENGNAGYDIILATVNYLIQSNVEALYLKGTGLTGTGSGGDDTLLSAASAGANTMVGGGGNDLYYVSHAGDVVTELSGEGTDTVISIVSYTIPNNVEVLYVNGTGLTGTGSNGGDTLASIGAGPNTLVGLGGDDRYFVTHSGDVVTEAANAGYDIVISTTSYTLPANVEALYLVGSGLTGTGTAGADTLLSAGGPNTLIGLGGDDLYCVNNAGDVVTEAANAGYDTVISTVNYTMPANVDALYMVGSGLTGTGSAGADALFSYGGANTLIGLGGDDLYYVNNIADVVTEAVNGGFDAVMASVSYTMPTNVEVLYLSGTGLTGTGTAVSETLVTLGANTLTGGGGNDVFVFLSGNANGAAVSDFDSAVDHDLLIFSGFGTAAQGATFAQIGVTDNWQIHSGLDSHDETVTLTNHAVPHAGDFVFV